VTVFSKSWRRPGALITVAAAGVLGVGLSAVPAAAHTPVWSVNCPNVSVDLTAYNGGGGGNKNTVEVTADGQDILPVTNFGTSFHKDDIPIPPGAKSLHLSVKAFDGSQYSKEADLPVPDNCVPAATPTDTAPSKTDTPVATPSATKSETPEAVDASSAAPSTSAAALPASQPSPAGDNLAETGSSSSTPIIAGGAAVVLVAGAGILWASRKRRATQH
jgi:LPXTG-motif cell wall-anchored protein